MQLHYAPPCFQKQTIFLSGALNAVAMAELRNVFDIIANSEVTDVTIDFTHVSRLDASGVGAIVFLFKRLKNTQRTLKITGVHGQPEAVIRLLRMEKAINTQFLD
ncbi:STAS domain-containing protein [Terasakiella sp. SH-1]|uniref:STAS domain-containing protein n=1 Tax=Terasakiella sp. SH-1 TaxID=2560057 RepID=UPI0010731530|nr:STAS domain-containing protein [Terasakiella sp. SH-1]